MRTLYLCVCAMIGLAILGCGKSESPEQASSSADATSSSGSGALVYIIADDAKHLDPALPTDMESFTVNLQIYETLVEFVPGTTDIRPLLAESFIVSNDAKTYTFTLREGVTFHDGTPLDSEAVRFSFERQINKEHPFHVGGFMAYAEYVFGDNVSAIETPDARTVVIRLNDPYIPFLRNLAIPTASIVSPSAVKKFGADFTVNPCGTGPYRLAQQDDWRRDQIIRLTRHDNYWGAAPKPPHIFFRVIKDAQVRFSSIKRGDAHMMIGADPTSLADAKQDASLVVHETPGLNLSYLDLNNRLDSPPLNNKLVRQALSTAINRDYICGTIMQGIADPATGIIPPGILGHNAHRKGYPYDPERAKALLAEAGYPNGFKIEILTYNQPRPYNPKPIEMIQSIQEDWRKIGVEASIRMMDFGALIDAHNSGHFQSNIIGWMTDNGDPDNFLYVLAGEPNVDNGYENLEARALMREAARTADEKKRDELYRQAEQIVMEDSPLIPLNHAKQIVVTHRSVKGFVPSLIGLYQLRDVSVE